MRKTETILMYTIIASIIGNLFWIEFSTEILGIAITVLAIIYFYLGFALFNDIPFRKIFKNGSFKEISKGRIIGSIGLGISLSIILIGFMFKFLILPDPAEMLIIGSVYLIIISCIAALIFIVKYHGKSTFYTSNFKRIIPILLIGIFSYLLPTDTLIDIRYRNRPEYAEQLKKSLKYPSNEQILNEEELESRSNELNN